MEQVMTIGKISASLMLVACLAVGALVGACGQASPPILAEEVTGEWCSGSGDLLTVEAGGKFELVRLSPDFFAVLHEDDEFVDGYLLDRDYGGVQPEAGNGSWTFGETATSPRVRLEFDKLGSSVNPPSGELIVRRTDEGEVGLFGYESDPDEGYTVRFLKC
ncbi:MULTISPECIES: hypothetical protein [unclassified Micromonospora]|uniref:hypothetical protein n=1 Tax=unclassified Micromonospora TaxID=2617518 RepID=UPI00098CF8AC|nr:MULTISPECIES: hypothetical protein [unclassified Micromonospora]OON31090.1 hypothetical protein BSA16_12730 [Micromonospora sp. Rc5]